MSNYDQYSGHQVRFLRTDPTGRSNPLKRQWRYDDTASWVHYMGGAVFACAIAVLFYLGC